MKKYYKAEFTFSLPEGIKLTEKILIDAMFDGFRYSILDDIEIFHVGFKDD